MNQKILSKLEQKKMLFLHEHLQEAIINGKVKNRYQLLADKLPAESDQSYIDRLRKFAAEFQFVTVPFNRGQQKYVSFGVPGPIETAYGRFFVIPAEVVGGRWGVHYFMFHPNYKTMLNSSDIMLRIDSGCFSGMVLGDDTCDCLRQLREAQKLYVELGGGIIIEIPGHDGRGWGEYKMANQKIMKDLAYNTIKAAESFYGREDKIDIRTYEEAVIILQALGFGKNHTFHLATSNPFKIKAFETNGMKVSYYKPMNAEISNPIITRNLLAKKKYWQKYKQ